MQVGLEAISFDVPKYYVDMEELARARQTEPAKFTLGLGQREMAVASPCEDTVTLAAGAAQRLIDTYDIDPTSIGLFIVGTETAVDHSKPVSSHVHGLLGLSKQCRVFETKHACYGAMAGVAMASDWVLSGRAQGKKALIIASDIARYGVGTAGEPTQGAGAVAMLVSDTPKLVAFESQYQGYYSSEVMDFWRPTYSKEAFADGHYSIQCYLDALSGAFSMYRDNYLSQNPDAAGGALDKRFAACLYHVPFTKMAKKAHQRLLECGFGEPLAKDDPRQAEVAADFSARVAPALRINAQVGNIYTGSLFLSLFDFLESQGADNVGKCISLFSYGSGCAAEFFSAEVLPTCAQVMAQQPSADILNQRVKISVEDYESMLMRLPRRISMPPRPVIRSVGISVGPFIYTGTSEHKRRYLVKPHQDKTEAPGAQQAAR
ncbi:MAG: hydroxymethylglutaryl-CoA synthase [Myxococcota bacterium]